MKQTAIDFLIKILSKNNIIHSSDISKANDLFQSQINSAYTSGFLDGMNKSPKNYFEKTFKK